MGNYMIIDGNRVEFDKEKNILALVRKAGIELPTFCYYSELSIFGACRMCVVEDEWGGVITSCSTPPKHKMSIQTNSPKLHQHRKMILELLLSSHCRDCTVCEKSGNCRLQELAHRFGITTIRFKSQVSEIEIDNSSESIVLDKSKCILCGDCVRMCNEVQNVGAIDFAYRGAKMIVSPAFGKKLSETNCVSCGQCAAVCPTAAITIKRDFKTVWREMYKKNTRVVVQVAPAVRVALGEEFGLKPGEDVMGKITAALRMLGFEAVYDTSFSADMTIMEEAKELVEKLEFGDMEMPLFTSCCPAWVRYAETKHPEIMPYVSSCKSPMEMFGAVIREYYRPLDRREKKETISVAIMPCSAKKAEAAREEFTRHGKKDVDYVLTTKEIIKMIKEIGIQFNELEAEAADMPFSIYSGGGVIFGATGGVMEAAIRRVAEKRSAKSLKEIEFSGIRGMQGVKEADVELVDKTLHVAVVSGLANAEELIRKIKAKEVQYDFVEVMACPGGCVGGAGQPFGHREEKNMRAKGLYKVDRLAQVKRCDENPAVQSLYGDLLKNRTEELLHVHYTTKNHAD